METKKTEIYTRDRELLAAISTFSKSALSISEILDNIVPDVPRRTLQRMLERLVAHGYLQVEGAGAGRRYIIASVAEEKPDSKVIHASYGIENLQLSAESLKIKAYVEQPIGSRKPVGYNREFIDAYIPNRTFLLNTIIRAHLQQIGQLPKIDEAIGTYSPEIFNRLLIDLSWNSSRLEGNTYSLLETERLIIEHYSPAGKSAFETQMILNHKEAIEFLTDMRIGIGFNSYTILNLHALLAEGLLGNPSACGQLRKIQVAIGKTTYQPILVPRLLEEIFQQILDKANAITDPFEQAFFALVHFAYLQAFEDINKRVSRLAANIPLIKSYLSPLSFVDVPEKAYIDGMLGVYELNKVDLLRDIFVWAYERSALKYALIRGGIGEPDPFKLRYRDQIKEMVRKIVLAQLDKNSAAQDLHAWAAINVKSEDYERFTTAIETELLELHEGNIARYKLSLTDFNKWHVKFH